MSLPLNHLTLGSIAGCWLLPWTLFTHTSQWDRFVRWRHWALLQGRVAVQPVHLHLLRWRHPDGPRLTLARLCPLTIETKSHLLLCFSWDSTFVSRLLFHRTPQAGLLSSEGPFVCSYGSRQQMYYKLSWALQHESTRKTPVVPPHTQTCRECTQHVTYLSL